MFFLPLETFCIYWNVTELLLTLKVVLISGLRYFTHRCVDSINV